MEDARAREILRALLQAAIAAADPRRILAAALPAAPQGRIVVVGMGKSAALMAAAVEAAWPEAARDGSLGGVVVTRYGHKVPTRRIMVLEASHPVPDRASEEGAKKILEAVRGLSERDLVLALISGGGSALACLPAPGLTLGDLQAVNRVLLQSGATIVEMNTVRKHLSAFKGGRLARAAMPAKLVSIAISDVPGDDPAAIASGPTVVDPSTFAEARTILARHGVEPPPAVARRLAGEADETPKPGSLPEPDFRFIATPSMALAAAAVAARGFDLSPLILGDALQGEAREMGTVLGGIARSVASHGEPLRPPAVLRSGGEATVTLGGTSGGRGGRNMEFLLGLALELEGANGIWAIAADSDGIDGTEDAAGAVIGPATLAYARACGPNAREALARHDSYGFFAATGELVRTGPTLTNVNDFRAILIA
ncbi:MAG: glycerate kinase type-2 family protein [Acetobacteraceae bacterium]